MTVDKLTEAIKDIPSGTFFRLTYKTALPIKKEYADKVSILKVVDMTTRTGINYRNVADKKDITESYSTQNKNSFRWHTYNRIKYHPDKDAYYFVVAPIKKGSNVDSYYQVCYNGVMHLVSELTDMFEEYVRPSYFTKSKSGGKVININVENIIAINGEVL